MLLYYFLPIYDIYAFEVVNIRYAPSLQIVHNCWLLIVCI